MINEIENDSANMQHNENQELESQSMKTEQIIQSKSGTEFKTPDLIDESSNDFQLAKSYGNNNQKQEAESDKKNALSETVDKTHSRRQLASAK